MTNITEIAKKANVSRTTVSRVLNNHPYVKPEKRDAVLKAMKELNYVPNFNAINLSRGKTNVFGVIVPKINHPFFSKLIAGIGEECNKHNYSLLVHQSNNDPEQEMEFFNRLKYKLIDGLILGSCVSPITYSTRYLGMVILFPVKLLQANRLHIYLLIMSQESKWQLIICEIKDINPLVCV
nr:LacI family DNA-binding transcriptional regulator [Bacillus velezensis]